jgi:hypothetical protein
MNPVLIHFFSFFSKKKAPADAGALYLCIQELELSCAVHSTPGQSLPAAAATGTDTGVG